ncbi:DEAD/DEAH box helicase [Trebonia sp.]|uniref:DEAD/DEAH box helicase n=1 Tax=Trebonia sp. TaxID=2767075 RepID=UPI0026085DD4|nr:DEAD/DEAH box helicase [Trebonia sp.]
MLDAELVFVPNEVPRRGVFAAWGRGPGNPVPGNAKVELVFPAGTYGIRKRMVSAELIPLAEALPLLLSAENALGMRRSVRVWAAAAAAGVGLIARGRLLPTVGPGDTDVWRAGPLDPSDLSWLRELAAAFPPAAHAIAVPGSRPMRLRSPESLVRDLWDAIADTIVRSPAAARTTAATAFAAVEATEVGDLADWLADTTDGLSAGARLGLRIEAVPPRPGPGQAAEAFGGEAEFFELDPVDDLPAVVGFEDVEDVEEAGPAFRLVLQLRSTADPSLIVDAAALWSQPETVLARFGPQAETDLLLALRRGASVWPPLAQVLEQASPSAMALDDDALSSLLGPAAEELAGIGIEVLWPASLADDGLKLRAAVTPAPERLTESGLGLDALLEFHWQLTLDGALLDADEIAVLAEAKRPLIRLRGRWVLLDPALLDRLRRPPRARMRTTEALGALLAGAAEIDGETVEITAQGPLADLAARVASLGSAPNPVETPAGLQAALRPYQQRGLAWLAGMCDSGLGGCLADDMGLGKTIQIIALHLHRRDLKAGPTLVVCPASLLGTWEREIRRFAPEIPVRRFHGVVRHLGDLAVDEVVLVTYGVVRRDSARLAETGWGLIVADEAQHAKNPLARTARSLRALRAPARVALTGTPVENRLSELWAILDWTTPGLLGQLEAFTRRIAAPIEIYRDPDTTRRFAALIRPFLLRRRKTDPGIAPELPRKTETDQLVPLTAEQVTLYEAMVRETMQTIATSEGIERAGLVFKLLTGLKQICNHPAQYLKQPGPLAGRSGKLAAFDELTDLILAGGESMLVFSQYTQMATLLQQHLDARGIRSLFLHGGVPVRRREEMVAEFQAGSVPVFLLSLKAGGTGLTLTRATHVLHYDRWWNPAVEDQATDRAYRIGQDRPVQVHRLIAEGTLEDRIAALLERKRDLADAVVGSGERWLAELSDNELAELVSLRAAS